MILIYATTIRQLMTDQSNNLIIAVVGGGAAGLMAAAAAGDAGCRILLFDTNDRLGRKIYATGNGRCNLTNHAMSDDYYNVDVMEHLWTFDHEALMDWFRARGVYLHDRNGYVYPRTDQAATIVAALERNLRAHSNVEIHLSERVTGVSKSDRPHASHPFTITTASGTYEADRVILATGGQVNRTYGCTGDGYHIAESMGHSTTTLSPALTPVYVDDELLRIASGVRCQARVTAVIDGYDVAVDTGEVQITEQGFSGIPVFQVSRWISQALAENRQAEITIDFLPDITHEELAREITRRQQDPTMVYVSDITAGLVHNKIGSYIARRSGLADEKKLARLDHPDTVIADLLLHLRHAQYPVTGTAGYDKAQVTAGGIPLTETREGFRSRLAEGLYITGELLDVDGMCGGYNLTWAMCSGYIAGRHAAAGR